MNKHKKLPLFWAAFSLLLLFTVNPALAGSNAKPVDVDTLFNCTWSSATNYPVTILDNPVATSGSNLYSFGGVSTAITAASNKFDGTTWTAIAPLPVALEFAGAVTDTTTGLIYILGGAEPTAGTPQTTVNRYDPVANTYTARAPFVTGVWNPACVYLAGKIYKIAGTGPATASTSVVEIYDVASNTWVAGPAYPLAISFVSGWTDGTFIYGAGGIQSVGSLPSNKTYRLDPANLGAGWVDAAIADLPATRWGAATAFYSPDAVLAGGYVAGAATANISNTAISYDLGTNTWNSIPNMVGERARFTAAVLGGSVYAVGGRSIASPAFVGTNSNQKLLCLNVPTNILGANGSSIAKGGSNGVLNPGNVVTVALGVRNTGGPGVVCTTTALTGTLQATGGVTAPSAPQNYGGSTGACSGITPALTTYRYFDFTVDPALPCGATVTASLQLQDGATNYGTFTYTFVTGKAALAFAQNFDGVVAPVLPAGWTSTATGIGVPWVTSTTNPVSAPNDAFAPDPSNIGDSFLVTPGFAVPAGGATLSFRINYITESTFDGVVLEFSTDGGGIWTDITTGGNAFISGGYTGVISTAFMSPIAGRQAWNGTNPGSPSYISSAINTPAAANGQPNVQLRWRMATDNSVAATGVRVDDISIATPDCTTAGPSLADGTLTPARSVLTHGGAGPLDISMPTNEKVSGLGGAPVTGGVESRRGTPNATNVFNYQVIVPFTAPVTVPGGVTVTSRDGATTAGLVVGSPGPNDVTVNLTAVADLPALATAPGTGEGQILGITLKDVTSGAAKGDINIQMGVLIGDSNDTRGVNAADSTQVKSRAGQVADAINRRSDQNIDGIINAGDTSIAKNHSGNLIP